jgi:hypothetical protein
MGEIVNFRRARKAKSRAEAAAQADANRMKHGVSKGQRDLVRAHSAKAQRNLTAHKLDKE